jgi:hypothetical protein
MRQRVNPNKLIFTVASTLVVLVLSVSSAKSIPAFARKYSTSCTTCHAPVPRLKAFGDDFAGNGFVLKDQDAPRYTMKTGDDNLDLIRSFPIAARLEGFIKYHSETGDNVDFSTPYNLKLLSGGSLGKNLAYYFYFFLSERGEVAGIEDAYLMFNDLFDRDLDIYLGQFQVSDPLFKREVRLTYEDYMIYKSTHGHSRINLTYDRGLMITCGIENGPDLIFELLNGNGIGEADESRTYDDDKYKTLAGRISYDFTEHIRAGAFGYYGQEGGMAYELEFNPVTMEYDTTDSGYRKNTVSYYGPDLTVSLEPVELNLQYMERVDDNAGFEFSEPAEDTKIKGGFAECIYWPNGDKSRWYLVGLYNRIDVDEGDDGSRTIYQTFTAHAGYLLRTNLRLIVENTYDIENEENRFVLGFVSAF